MESERQSRDKPCLAQNRKIAPFDAMKNETRKASEGEKTTKPGGKRISICPSTRYEAALIHKDYTKCKPQKPQKSFLKVLIESVGPGWAGLMGQRKQLRNEKAINWLRVHCSDAHNFTKKSLCVPLFGNEIRVESRAKLWGKPRAMGRKLLRPDKLSDGPGVRVTVPEKDLRKERH